MLLTSLLIISLLFSTHRRLLRYLRYLQQEDYTPHRFFRWIFINKLFDTRLSLVACCSFLISFFDPQLALIIGALLTFTVAYLEENPQKEGKITLKMTDRAKRIYATAFVLQSLILLGLFYSSREILALSPSLNWLWAALSAQAVPFSLLSATFFLSYGEKQRQNNFKAQAQAKLFHDKPHIIGITGSYGKTSAKNLLANTLQIALGPTFWPNKGVNTLMGTAREINQKWQKGYRYAVMEMGAYYSGSIKRLCEFTPPESAWITYIGLAHLERFKTADTILKTKAELADSLSPGSLLVLNGDSPGCRLIGQKHTNKKVVLYGLDNHLGDLDVWIKSYTFSEKGTHFDLVWNNQIYSSSSPMLGSAALSNIAGTFAMACSLGASPELTLAAIAQIQPIGNRLHIEKTTNGILYLHDAYNSNPIGFQSALNVLKELPAKRRLLMTPGMIELGSEQEILNAQVIKLAASLCDFILIVGSHNFKALKKGLEEVHFPENQIFLCKNRDVAFEKLREIQQPEDAILIENDLGDLHEQLPRF